MSKRKTDDERAIRAIGRFEITLLEQQAFVAGIRSERRAVRKEIRKMLEDHLQMLLASAQAQRMGNYLAEAQHTDSMIKGFHFAASALGIKLEKV